MSQPRGVLDPFGTFGRRARRARRVGGEVPRQSGQRQRRAGRHPVGAVGDAWTGPVQLPIDQLHRLAGPPGDPVLCAVADDYWRDDVDELGEKVEDGWEPPPVIVAFREGELTLEDGNHRVEGVRRSGEEH